MRLIRRIAHFALDLNKVQTEALVRLYARLGLYKKLYITCGLPEEVAARLEERMLALALTAVPLASCIPITPDGSKVPSPSGSFVAVHGALQVVDGQLRDAHDAPIQLRGVSLPVGGEGGHGPAFFLALRLHGDGSPRAAGVRGTGAIEREDRLDASYGASHPVLFRLRYVCPRDGRPP